MFRYGFATLRTEHNPVDILRGALIAPRVKHHAAIVEPTKVGELLGAIENYSGKLETRIALQLAPHVFLRPGELRHGRWSEIDFAEKGWRIPAERMKMRQPHAVPLSRQAVYLLQELRSLARPSEFLFPALHTTKQAICENTLNVAVRRLGYEVGEMTSHGFRAMASTLLKRERAVTPRCDRTRLGARRQAQGAGCLPSRRVLGRTRADGTMVVGLSRPDSGWRNGDQGEVSEEGASSSGLITWVYQRDLEMTNYLRG